jgi:hypothetical protein
VLGHFGILATRGSKDKGTGRLTCEVLGPRYFGISATGGSKDEGTRHLTCEVPVHDILAFRQPGVQRMKGRDA